MTDKPDIACPAAFPTIPVPDIIEAVDYYTEKLGFRELFLWGEPPSHAAVALDEATIHFWIGPAVNQPFWLYLHVDNVDEVFQWYHNNGVELLDAPETQIWGMREFNMRDLNGYQLRFGQSDWSHGDPVRVERVNVDVRLEKRLAQLLVDLAGHKQMTVGQTLEETLLHSFEAMPDFAGQGVASPHTKRTLRHIAELKKKHRIDYDTHDTYRFTED
ncbi:MAG: VOC family protein [Pirellulaceae bacterium]